VVGRKRKLPTALGRHGPVGRLASGPTMEAARMIRD